MSSSEESALLPAISFVQVKFAHPTGVTALEDVSLAVEKGELLAIVGENGAGKTTLVKHVNGLLKPTKGTVQVFGVNTRDASVAQLSRRVGIVFQNADHQLFAESVEEEVAYALRNFGLGAPIVRKAVERALGSFGLSDYRATSPMMLSGGEKKRLCIATVLAWEPDIVILDEPTVGQDYAQKERLGETIRMLITQGKTVVLVSHDLEFLWPLQPRFVVMAGGRIIADGPASTVLQRSETVERGHLLRPQLLEFYLRLTDRPPNPFANVYEAKRWLQQLRAGGDGASTG
jgi:energy-coupling factor transport system ATP-binding protein